MELIEELKRRNVFRVAAAYAVVCWIILQLCDILFPAVELPETDIRYVVYVLAAIFPLLMAFCWFFEITPDGLRPTRRVADDASIRSETGRKIDFVIIGLLSVALAFFMYEYFARPEPLQAAMETNATSAVDAASVPAGDSMPEKAEKGPALDPRPSIAVLPFVNMSSDQENEYFADGLTEELLNALAQLDGLRVAGRTSSF
ncbi:MAG: hypothetical protein KDI19_14300, partial [Pseudomonadales bacterium]|nr:hypothetical protein [Pseudomonadales bacterium]